MNFLKICSSALIINFNIYAMDGREVLSESVEYFNASNDGRITSKQFPSSWKLVNDISTILNWKKIMDCTGAKKESFPENAPKNGNQILAEGIKGIDIVGMGRFNFSKKKPGYLYTDYLNDCIGFAAYDPKSGKSCLYHVSKIELRDEKKFDYFLSQFFDYFEKDKLPEIEIKLIGSCYSNDLKILLEILKKNGLKVTSYNFPDIALEEKTVLDEEDFIASIDRIIVIGENTTIKDIRLPCTSILMSTLDGSISIKRS